ncbi:hypothetical protein [Gordonia sp. ABSL49_1]|uniref:hypothetical protein n=1 Tax=Gordonia sp. ABSL49_1 TaxID=2920941 RepID=UPI001F10C76C|nr:hypothetical protein [Gordonia sp. ABSL49_1]MCH5641436.1 hypothetical protein [Gordonia sp. ABSL49_1]
MPEERNWVETPHYDFDRDWHISGVMEGDIVNGKSLESLAGLGTGWMIVGLNIYPPRASADSCDSKGVVHVHAVNTEELGLDTYEAVQRYGAEHGGLPVTDILLHDVSLQDVLRQMAKIHIHIRGHGHANLKLYEVKRTDFPNIEYT